MPNSFLGSGWKFPLALNATGGIAMANDEENIRQSIWMILNTAPGERVMRPDFGCGIHELVFAPNTPGTAGQVIAEVHEALVRWEPRVDVLDVDAVPDDTQPNLLLIAIAYQVRTTNNRFNLVYPFYLES
jgi:uncharacterized protein